MVTYFSEIWHHSGILRAEVNHSLWREMPPALFGCCFWHPPPNLWCRFHSVECYKSQRRACPLLEVRAPRGHCQACHRAGGPVFPGLSSLSFRLSPPPLQSSCSCSASHLPLPPTFFLLLVLSPLFSLLSSVRLSFTLSSFPLSPKMVLPAPLECSSKEQCCQR